MFQVKICGITNVEDARSVASAGADAIGLNFYAKSPRCVATDMAERIVADLPKTVKRVGVFVNAPASEIKGLVARLSLDMVQLHGDEPPELLCELEGVPIIRAFRFGGDESPDEYLERCRVLSAMPAMTLVDAFHKEAYGGTGQTIRWSEFKSRRREFGPMPLALAGGLTAENVAEAIAQARPEAVDTASGVEVSPGRKSPEQIDAFVAAAKRAFEIAGRNH